VSVDRAEIASLYDAVGLRIFLNIHLLKKVGESLAVRLPPQPERYPCSRGKRWSRPEASAALFRRRSAGSRIPEFFSRSAVSLVTAKGGPSEVE